MLFMANIIHVQRTACNVILNLIKLSVSGLPTTSHPSGALNNSSNSLKSLVTAPLTIPPRYRHANVCIKRMMRMFVFAKKEICGSSKE
jgi:hypothetical protein